MNNNLEITIRAASEAFLNVAEEAKKINEEVLQLRARLDQHEKFNQDLKKLFDTYYGGQR